MLSEKNQLAALPWLSTGFCAALSLICLVAHVALPLVTGSDTSSAWVITFLCFLPMCFFFVGSGIWQMQREIGELRKQLAEIRNNENA